MISDVSEFMLISPVKIVDKQFISKSTKIDINAAGKKLSDIAYVLEIDNNIKIVNGIQVVTVTSIISGSNKYLVPNLIVDCYIQTGSLSPIDYLGRVWQRMVN